MRNAKYLSCLLLTFISFHMTYPAAIGIDKQPQLSYVTAWYGREGPGTNDVHRFGIPADKIFDASGNISIPLEATTTAERIKYFNVPVKMHSNTLAVAVNYDNKTMHLRFPDGSLINFSHADAQELLNNPLQYPIHMDDSPITTKKVGPFRYSNAFKLPLSDNSTIKFKAKAPSDLWVVFSREQRLSSVLSSSDRSKYYIACIGGNGNTKSHLGIGYPGSDGSAGGWTALKTTTDKSSLLSSSFEDYWITIKYGTLSWGKGVIPGENQKQVLTRMVGEKNKITTGEKWATDLEYVFFGTQSKGGIEIKEINISSPPIEHNNIGINNQRVKTQQVGPFYYSNAFKLPFPDNSTIKFKATAPSDLWVVFSPEQKLFSALSSSDRSKYCIACIGGDGNTKSHLGIGYPGSDGSTGGWTAFKTTTDKNSLLSSSFEDYWITIKNGTLSWGKGAIPGENQKQVLTRMPSNLTYIFFGTRFEGEIQIKEFNIFPY